MADRNFNRVQALEKEIKTLYAEVAIGASGAPTLTKGLGIASISRTGAGRYTVTTEDQFTRLMHAEINYHFTTSGDFTFQLTAHSESSKTVSFASKAAAVDTDPASGSILFIRLDFKNSSVGE